MAEFPWFESRRAHHLRSSRSKHSHQSRISAESRAVFSDPWIVFDVQQWGSRRVPFKRFGCPRSGA
jgi:hypothetical protein